MAGFRMTLGGIFLAGAFVFAILMFTVSFITINNPEDGNTINTTFGLNSSISKLFTTMQEFNATINDAKSKLDNSSPLPLQFAFLIAYVFFEIPKMFLGVILNMVNFFTVFIDDSFAQTGFGQALSFAIQIGTALAYVAIVFLIIKFIRTGESER